MLHLGYFKKKNNKQAANYENEFAGIAEVFCDRKDDHEEEVLFVTQF